MKAKHTPGPWWWIRCGCTLVSADENQVLAIDLPEHIGDEDKALIAAAPNLLKALKALVARIEDKASIRREGVTGGAYLVSVTDCGSNWADEFAMAEAAIEEAEGPI
jgi:hypothetical protein